MNIWTHLVPILLFAYYFSVDTHGVWVLAVPDVATYKWMLFAHACPS